MAKQSYGIPYGLNSTYLDMEIAIQNDNGIGLKPFPIRNILIAFGGILGGYMFLAHTIVARGSFGQKVTFIVLWIALCALLLTTNKTKLLGLQKILSLLNYLQPDNRFVSTRATDNVNNMCRISGIEYVEDTGDNSGLIHYTNGTFGIMFDVIGNASVLLFKDHQEAIVDRVDDHYCKMKPGVSYQFITRREPQNVALQVSSMDEREQAMTVYDPDLAAMFETSEYVLTKLVGNAFKSLHQYLIIQADTLDELNQALNVFYGETDNSSLMFKYAERLNYDEVCRIMADINGTRKEF